DRFDPVAAVEQADGNHVTADAVRPVRPHRPPDAVPAAAPRAVEGGRQFGQGTALVETVVLDLHQGQDVGIKLAHGGDQFGALALRQFAAGRATLRGEAAAAAVTVEEIEHVEAGHAHAASAAGRGLRTRGLFDAGDGSGELQAPAAVALVDHALPAVQQAADPVG